jgi:ATP-binding cassette, subfamily C (CFTR/MRP), member 1
VHSGKSSLLLSLVRMLHVCSGSITIDGIDISKIPREDVRFSLITITQDQFFLPGTWRQNIDPHGTATTEQITEVLTKVGLLEVVGRDDQNSGIGLDGDFEEDKLSRGQRQLFFLAEAVLRGKGHGRVVLMDEATSRSVFCTWGGTEYYANLACTASHVSFRFCTDADIQ